MTPGDLDLGSADALRRWAADVQKQTANVIAAALDATAPLCMRDLGRREARRIVTEASDKLDALFAAAGTDTTHVPTSTPSADAPAYLDTDPMEIADAWREIKRARDDLGEMGAPVLTMLLAACTGMPGEMSEIDTPGIAVLRAIRATVDAWAHARGGSTLFAAVSFVDLDLLTRRLDAAIALVRHDSLGGET